MDPKTPRIHEDKLISHYHQACWLMGTDELLKQLEAGTFCAQTYIKQAKKESRLFLKDLKKQETFIYPRAKELLDE